MRIASLFTLIFIVILSAAGTVAAGDAPSGSRLARWMADPMSEPEFFPIAVWAQDPVNAKAYKEIGIDVYISLHNGPTEEQLAQLKEADMPAICNINSIGLAHKDDPLIWAWMHGDEPDNAQSIMPGWDDEYKDKKFQVYIDGKYEFGTKMASTHPGFIRRDYWMISNIDTTRPVYLNLGWAVAAESSPGRGLRAAHPEDYLEYVKGGDIISFDIYPLNYAEDSEHFGKLEMVGTGVERLCRWSGGKPVWTWIECTRYGTKGVKPTPAQVRAEVWIALTHGARGFGYFCHVLAPEFNDAAPLSDPEMKAAMAAINTEVHGLAPVLNSPTVTEGVSVESETPVKVMVKKHGGATYVFAVSLGNGLTEARISVAGLAGKAAVIGENRKVTVKKQAIADSFSPYAVHLYKVQ